MTLFETPPTVEEIMNFLESLPKDARVCVTSDERMGDFYVHGCNYDPESKRVVFSPPECMNACTADEMDDGSNWWNIK